MCVPVSWSGKAGFLFTSVRLITWGFVDVKGDLLALRAECLLEKTTVTEKIASWGEPCQKASNVTTRLKYTSPVQASLIVQKGHFFSHNDIKDYILVPLHMGEQARRKTASDIGARALSCDVDSGAV